MPYNQLQLNKDNPANRSEKKLIDIGFSLMAFKGFGNFVQDGF